MPNEDLRRTIDETARMAKEVIDVGLDTDARVGILMLFAGIQAEQLQRIGHTLHQVAGTLEALLKEVRNVSFHISVPKPPRVDLPSDRGLGGHSGSREPR